MTEKLKDCPKCKGDGTVMFMYPRIGTAPGNMRIKCEKCNGTGRVRPIDRDE